MQELTICRSDIGEIHYHYQGKGNVCLNIKTSKTDIHLIKSSATDFLADWLAQRSVFTCWKPDEKQSSDYYYTKSII